jgi:ribosomal protein S27AE
LKRKKAKKPSGKRAKRGSYRMSRKDLAVWKALARLHRFCPRCGAVMSEENLGCMIPTMHHCWKCGVHE